MSVYATSSFIDLGEKFLRCGACKRVGKEGWAHICMFRGTARGNWYANVAELRAALSASRLSVPATVRGYKP